MSRDFEKRVPSGAHTHDVDKVMFTMPKEFRPTRILLSTDNRGKIEMQLCTCGVLVYEPDLKMHSERNGCSV